MNEETNIQESDLILEDNKQVFRVTLKCVEGENEGQEIYREFVVEDKQVPDGLEVFLQSMVETINANQD